jgi:L-rhamnose mutarotase
MEQHVTRRLCHAIDLKDDPAVLAQYERRHEPGGPPAEVNANIRRGGVVEMEIYRVADRLFMIMEVGDDFDPAALAEADTGNPVIRAWSTEMAALQRPIAATDEPSWAEMTCVYRLSEQP